MYYDPFQKRNDISGEIAGCFFNSSTSSFAGGFVPTVVTAPADAAIQVYSDILTQICCTVIGIPP